MLAYSFALNEASSSALLGLYGSFTNHGWDKYGGIRWINQAFPGDFRGIFFNNLYDDKQFDFGSDSEESEDENEN